VPISPRSAQCLLALFLVTSGCKHQDDAQADAPLDVSVLVAHRRAVEITDYLPGRVSAARMAEIRPQVNGVVVKRMFQQGAFVTAGQQLYQIDPAPYQADLDRGTASLKHGQAELLSAEARQRRFTKLSKIDAVSQQDLDDAVAARAEAQADIAAAQAQIDMAQINLRYARVLSPISGRAGRTILTEGALVTADQPAALTTVTQLDPVYVDLTTTGETVLRLRREMMSEAGKREPQLGHLSLVLQDGSTYEAPGKIDMTEVIVDRDTGMTTLRATFKNPRSMLLPGMFIHANIDLGTQQAVLVPQNAVLRDIHDDPYVFVVDGKDILQQRTIKTTRSSGDDWIVSDGLADGDRVVIDGLISAHAGLHAHVTHTAPDAG